MTMIDMTPTRAESARICAYILAMQSDTSPYDFGDYWNYSEAEEEVIFKAYSLWESYQDFWESTDLSLADVPKSHRIKAVKACIAKARQ